jgi:hypothetical protein
MGQAGTQFALSAGEQIVFETNWGSWLKSMVQVTAGRVVLTNQRLVFCDTGYTGYGIIFIIMQFLTPATRVVWEVPIEDIARVSRERHGFASKYVVSCSSGPTYTVQVGTGDSKWKEGLASRGITVMG